MFNLPNEILVQICLSLADLASVIALSSTCHRLYDVYHSSKRLEILQEAADAEFGPIQDIIQLLTQNASQPAHRRRQVPMSFSLLKQIIKVGRVATRYEEIYPFKKWKTDYGNRRFLTKSERYGLRRAVYRLWLFDKAFHNAAHIRTCRKIPEVDVHLIMRDMVSNNICPSNGKVRQKFQKRFPDSKQQLLFNIHLNYPPAPSPFVPDSSYHTSSRCQSHLAPSRWHEPGAEGWGDDITQYYVVEDMMKLDPEQLLYLRNHCPLKLQVETHVRGLGEWFVNNGETFSETLGFVIRQRGGDLEQLKMCIEDGESGIVLSDE